MSERLLKSPGDPRKLLAYKKAEIIYLLTFRFCERFLKQRKPTRCFGIAVDGGGRLMYSLIIHKGG